MNSVKQKFKLGEKAWVIRSVNIGYQNTECRYCDSSGRIRLLDKSFECPECKSNVVCNYALRMDEATIVGVYLYPNEFIIRYTMRCSDPTLAWTMAFLENDIFTTEEECRAELYRRNVERASNTYGE